MDSTVLERFGKQEGSLKGHDPRRHGRPDRQLGGVRRQVDEKTPYSRVCRSPLARSRFLGDEFSIAALRLRWPISRHLIRPRGRFLVRCYRQESTTAEFRDPDRQVSGNPVFHPVRAAMMCLWDLLR
jgi:hypothetical protein